MIWKETKTPLGNEAMIFFNSDDGTISSDPAYHMLCCGEGLNELFNGDRTPGIYVRMNSGIHEKCGIWVENGKWYPIIQLADGSFLVAYFADWKGLESFLEDKCYRESYENCQKLVDIVRKDLGGDEEEDPVQHCVFCGQELPKEFWNGLVKPEKA